MPELYECLFPAMVHQWRSAFPTQGDEDVPFVFVQVAPWPANDVGYISGIRYAQDVSRSGLSNVGMAVAADIGDPAGAYHPIHPCFKQEVGRRLDVTMSRLQRRKQL